MLIIGVRIVSHPEDGAQDDGVGTLPGAHLQDVLAYKPVDKLVRNSLLDSEFCRAVLKQRNRHRPDVWRERGA